MIAMWERVQRVERLEQLERQLRRRGGPPSFESDTAPMSGRKSKRHPPFNSNKNYSAPIGSQAAGAAFKDTWSLNDLDEAWHGEVAEQEPALYAIIDSALISGLNATALTAPGAVKPLVPRKPPLFPATTEASSALPRPSFNAVRSASDMPAKRLRSSREKKNEVTGSR